MMTDYLKRISSTRRLFTNFYTTFSVEPFFGIHFASAVQYPMQGIRLKNLLRGPSNFYQNQINMHDRLSM